MLIPFDCTAHTYHLSCYHFRAHAEQSEERCIICQPKLCIHEAPKLVEVVTDSALSTTSPKDTQRKSARLLEKRANHLFAPQEEPQSASRKRQRQDTELSEPNQELHLEDVPQTSRKRKKEIQSDTTPKPPRRRRRV